MKWIKTYEAKANQYRNEKLKKLKKYVNLVLPLSHQVQSIVNMYIFNEEYDNLCDEYLIPHMVKKNTHIQRSINLSLESDYYQAFVKLNVDPENEIEYGGNYSGMTRLLNDYYSGEVSEPIYDEKNKIDKDGNKIPIQQLRISPRFGVLVNVIGNKCELMFHYQLHWAGFPAINTHSYEPKLEKDILTRKDILEFLAKESEFFSNSIKVHFKQFEEEFKNKYVKIIKDIVYNSGKPTYKQAKVLNNYPLLMDMLGINPDQINKGSQLDDMGFDD